jgi:hypothetical protein
MYLIGHKGLNIRRLPGKEKVMPLSINKSQEENDIILQNFVGNRDKVFVYKIVVKSSWENFYRSPRHGEFIWDFNKHNIFEINRSSKPTEEERESGEIAEGLHVYASFKDDFMGWDFYGRKTVKFEVEREDIVAVDEAHEELVCKKLTFVEFSN